MHSVRRIVTAFSLLLVLSAPGLAQSTNISGSVVRVIDGDTLVLREAGGVEYRVRLQGIDAPEIGQPYGEEAKKLLTVLVLDKQVTGDCPKRDQYGRLVCKVITTDRADVGQAMLWGGLAWHYKFYQNEQTEADHTRYASAEDFARDSKAGLWADANAVAPWDYRQTIKNVREEVAEPGNTRPAPSGKEAAAAGPILGNRRSGIYHWPGCPNYADIAPDNRVPFPTREEAERAGYRAAKNCKDSRADASTTEGATTTTPSAPSSTGGTVNVRGYYRKDGTYVRPHTRSAPRKKN